MGILTGDAIVGYCLKQHSVIKEEQSLEFRLLKLMSARIFGQRQFLLTLYKQRGFLGSLVNQYPPSNSMQIDEGSVAPRELHLDLSMTRRLFNKLTNGNLDAIPNLHDFEREY